MISYDEKNQLVITLPKSGLELTMLSVDNIKGDHLRRIGVATQGYEPGSFINIMALVAVCTVKVGKPSDGLVGSEDSDNGFIDMSETLTIDRIKQQAVKSANSVISVKELLDLNIIDSLALMEVVNKEYNFLNTVG